MSDAAATPTAASSNGAAGEQAEAAPVAAQDEVTHSDTKADETVEVAPADVVVDTAAIAAGDSSDGKAMGDADEEGGHVEAKDDSDDEKPIRMINQRPEPKRDWVAIAYLAAVVTALVVTLAVVLQPDNRPVRQYYIAAEEVEWDFAPEGSDVCFGKPFSYKDRVFVDSHFHNRTDEANRIGSTYTKAQFVE